MPKDGKLKGRIRKREGENTRRKANGWWLVKATKFNF